MGIGSITPAQKLEMAAQVQRTHPAKNGAIALAQALGAEAVTR
jgi:hypothetical protein